MNDRPTPEEVRASEIWRDRAIALDGLRKHELVAMCRRLRPNAVYLIGGQPHQWTKDQLVNAILRYQDEDRQAGR